MVIFISVLLLIYLRKSAESVADLRSFICSDGSMIDLIDLCDGTVNCPDSSDEIQSLCHHVTCPLSYYRCTYGACIPRSCRCDGLQDCVDGSDELHCGLLKACSEEEYQCIESLECVSLTKTCNGYLDCEDGSDESAALCIDSPCSTHSYHCNYGGCVHREVICDGIYDCADGSDEKVADCAAINCRGNDCAEFTCRQDEFTCQHERQCISASRVCDGSRQCRDGSDETSEICLHRTCSEGYFRCAYGGCISKSLKCNSEANCHDWSDEDEAVCGSALPEGACRLPPPKPGIHVLISNCPHCRPGEAVPELTRLNFSCAANGFMEGSSSAFCQGNKWIPGIPFCFSDLEDVTCPPIEAPAARRRCEVLWGPKRGWIPCNISMPIGTRVTLECPPFYERESGASHTTCLHDGTWSQLALRCKPICGIRETSAVPLIVNGWEISRKESVPWHASLFSIENNYGTFFCGGSLIAERIVLTAGHCVWKTDAKTIRVVLAGFSSNFTLDESDEETQVFGVSDIKVQRSYYDEEGNYGSDLAVLVLDRTAVINSKVKPVCLDFSGASDVSLRSGEIGLVAGMGITENNTISQRLRVTNEKIIPGEECRESQKRDFRKYLTYTTFCAGWKNGTSVCNGDSGGGLALQRPNSIVWELHGIVSISPMRIGTNTCDPRYYTVFTKVAIYGSWIKDILDDIPSIGPPDLDQLLTKDILI